MLSITGKSTLAAALTAVLFGASADLPRAAEPTSQKKLTFRDIQWTVHARMALADDPILGPANLGVRVQDGVAVLWGPVPSEEARRRAVEIVKQVKGVFEVRDADVYVAVPPPEAPPPATPTRTESDAPDPLTGTIDALTARPAGDVPSPPAVLLGPPSPLSPRTVSAAPPDDLASALERVRLSESRFQAVDYRLEGDAVVLRRSGSSAEDKMAFARAISHLPGLSRIEVRDDAADPR